MKVFLGFVFLFAMLFQGMHVAKAEDIESKPVRTKVVLNKSHAAGIVAALWSPSEEQVLFSLDLNGVLVKTKVDTAAGKAKVTWSIQAFPKELGTLSMKLSPKGDILAVGANQGKILLLNTSDGAPIGAQFKSSRPFPAAIRAMDFSPESGSSGSFVTADSDGYLDFWKIGVEFPIFSVRKHDWPVNTVAYSKTGEFVFSADPAQALVWDANQGAVVSDLSDFAGHIGPKGSFVFSKVLFSQLENAAVVATNLGVFTYDLGLKAVTQKILLPIEAGKENELNVEAVSLSADNRHLIVLNGGNAFLVMDLEKGIPSRGYIDVGNLFSIGFTSRFSENPLRPTLFAVSKLVLQPAPGEKDNLKLINTILIYDFDRFEDPTP